MDITITNVEEMSFFIHPGNRMTKYHISYTRGYDDRIHFIVVETLEPSAILEAILKEQERIRKANKERADTINRLNDELRKLQKEI